MKNLESTRDNNEGQIAQKKPQSPIEANAAELSEVQSLLNQKSLTLENRKASLEKLGSSPGLEKLIKELTNEIDGLKFKQQGLEVIGKRLQTERMEILDKKYTVGHVSKGNATNKNIHIWQQDDVVGKIDNAGTETALGQLSFNGLKLAEDPTLNTPKVKRVEQPGGIDFN